MSSRSITIATFPIPGVADTVVIVTVSYPTIAGPRREYSVTAQPTRIERDEYGTMHRYNPREGYRRWLEEAPRYSPARLAKLAADPDTLTIARGMYLQILIDRGVDFIEADMISRTVAPV